MKEIIYRCDRCSAKVENGKDLYTITVHQHNDGKAAFFNHGYTAGNSIEVCKHCAELIIDFCKQE